MFYLLFYLLFVISHCSFYCSKYCYQKQKKIHRTIATTMHTTVIRTIDRTIDAVKFRTIKSTKVSDYLIFPYLTLSSLILPYLTLSHLITPYHTLSHLSYLIILNHLFREIRFDLLCFENNEVISTISVYVWIFGNWFRVDLTKEHNRQKFVPPDNWLRYDKVW